MKSKTHIGIALAVTGTFTSAGVASIVRYLSVRIPVVEIIFVAYVVCVLIHFLRYCYQAKELIVTPHWCVLTMRAITGIGYYSLMLAGVAYTTVLEGTLLRCTAPLWVPILVWIIWQQRPTRYQWIPIIVGFVGVVVFLHPAALHFNIGYLFALSAGFLYAVNTLITRATHDRQEPSRRTLFYSFVIGAIVMGFCTAYHWVPLKWNEALLLALAGIAVYFTVSLFVWAFRFAKPIDIAPMGNMIVVFGGIFDWLIWREIPTLTTLIGAILIISACVYIVRHTRQTATT